MSKLAEIRDEIEARLSHIDYAYGIKTAEEARQRHETNATLLFDVLDLLAIAEAAGEVNQYRFDILSNMPEMETKTDIVAAIGFLAGTLAKLEGE